MTCFPWFHIYRRRQPLEAPPLPALERFCVTMTRPHSPTHVSHTLVCLSNVDAISRACSKSHATYHHNNAEAASAATATAILEDWIRVIPLPRADSVNSMDYDC